MDDSLFVGHQGDAFFEFSVILHGPGEILYFKWLRDESAHLDLSKDTRERKTCLGNPRFDIFVSWLRNLGNIRKILHN